MQEGWERGRDSDIPRTSAAMKRLYLLRHAKSYWDLDWLDDIERPLSRRGKNDAPIMGRHLRGRAVQPDVIITSPSARTMATARMIAAELAIDPAGLVVEERLYEAGLTTLLQVLGELNAAVGSVMLVGHNPETTMFANRLTGAGIDNVPTTGVVGVGLHTELWSDIADCEAELLFFEYPKRLRSEDSRNGT